MKEVAFLFGCWENRGKIKYAGHDSQIGISWEKLKYAFTDYKILKFLDVLSRSKYAKPRLQEAEIANFSQNKTAREGLHPNQSTKSGPVLTLDKKETFEVDHSSSLVNIKENLQIEKRELMVYKG